MGILALTYYPHERSFLNLSTSGYVAICDTVSYMEPILFFLGASFVLLVFSFLLGFQTGRSDRHYENFKKILSDLKKNTVRAFTSRQKVVILNSKDSYLPDPGSEEEELL